MQLCENCKITVKLDVKLGEKASGIGNLCCCYSYLLEMITERWPWNWKNDPKLPYVISFSNLIFLFTLLAVTVRSVLRARALGCLVIFSSEKGEIKKEVVLFYQFRIASERKHSLETFHIHSFHRIVIHWLCCVSSGTATVLTFVSCKPYRVSPHAAEVVEKADVFQIKGF